MTGKNVEVLTGEKVGPLVMNPSDLTSYVIEMTYTKNKTMVIKIAIIINIMIKNVTMITVIIRQCL